MHLLGAALQQLHSEMEFPSLDRLITDFVYGLHYHNDNKELKWCPIYIGKGGKFRAFPPKWKGEQKDSLWVKHDDRLYPMISIYY